jgi:hypothetical protein
MVSYGDKKRSQAQCVAPDCPDVASVLRVVQGRPDWFCDEHALIVDERSKRGMP